MKKGDAKYFAALHRDLVGWYSANARDLPWRRTRDPYRIWMSEIMLQQTRVETVLPYYVKFLERFPSVNELAQADIDELRSLWAGLGYYTRVVNLQRAAQKVVELGGKFPATVADLRNLPGIGPYTAAAVASIAFGEKVAAIDGNLERVIARLLAHEGIAKGAPEIREFAAKLAALGDASEVNQGLMDLSSGICLPRNPQCLVCPLAKHCEARALGTTATIPVKAVKREKVELTAKALLIFHCETAMASPEILVARRPAGAWLQGMWDLPWWLADRDGDPNLPKLADRGEVSVKRTITHHKIRFAVRVGVVEKKPGAELLRKSLRIAGEEFRWIPAADVSDLPNPSRKAIARALESLID